MKINLYRLEKVLLEGEDITFPYFASVIKNDGYSKMGTPLHNNGLIYDLFVEHKSRKKKDWLVELPKLFPEFSQKIIPGEIYNGILTVRRNDNSKPVYAISLGYSFHIIQEHCDYNFAMDFAEKEITNDSVTSKLSDYIQSNKIRSLLNIKSDFLTANEGGESFKFVKGKPKFDGFGRSVECGYSIHFPKKYTLEKQEDLSSVTQLIMNVEESLGSPGIVNSFPRVTYIPKKDEKRNSHYDELLLKSMLALKTEDDFEIYTSDFDVIGANIIFNDNTSSYKIYIKGHDKEFYTNPDSLDKGEVQDFIRVHSEVIGSLNDVMVKVTCDGVPRQPVSIKNFLFGIVDDSDGKYMLTSGRWGKINGTFMTAVHETLERLDKDILKRDTSSFYHYADEDDYINQLIASGRWEKLHTIDIYVHDKYPKKDRPKIELADAYSVNARELYAIKLGGTYQTIIYAFDQANTAVKALKNGKDYKLSQQLKDNKVTKSRISSIVKCKKYATIIGFEQQYLREAIENDEFSLTLPESLLFKLKVISSASYIIGQGIDFSLYVIPGVRL